MTYDWMAAVAFVATLSLLTIAGVAVLDPFAELPGPRRLRPLRRRAADRRRRRTGLIGGGGTRSDQDDQRRQQRTDHADDGRRQRPRRPQRAERQCATGTCEDISSSYYLADETVGACTVG